MTETNTLWRPAAAAGGWVLAGRTAGLFLNAVATLLLARMLAPADFGVAAGALVALGVLETLTVTGFDTALIRHRDDIRPYLDTTFTVHAARGVLLALIAWIIAPLVARFFGNATVTPVLRTMTCLALLRGFANPGITLLNRQLEFGRLFRWEMPALATSLAISLGVAFVRRDVWALVAGAVAGQVLTTLISHTLSPVHAHFGFDRTRLRELANYGRWVRRSGILMYLSVHGDDLVLGKMLGTVSLGTYRVAYRLAELPVLAGSQVAATVALPALGALQTDRARLSAWYRWAFQKVLLANVAFALLVLLLADWITGTLLGAKWAGAAAPLRILAVAMLLRSILVLGSALFDAVGQPQLTFRLHLVRLLILAAAIVPLIHFMGVDGAALAVLLAGVGALPLYLQSARRVLAPEPALT